MTCCDAADCVCGATSLLCNKVAHYHLDKQGDFSLIRLQVETTAFHEYLAPMLDMQDMQVGMHLPSSSGDLHHTFNLQTLADSTCTSHLLVVMLPE